MTERKWVEYYGGTMAYRKDNAADADLADLSPDYTEEEIRHIWEGNKFATPLLLPQVLSREPWHQEARLPSYPV
jgi:hypothetical protein